MSGFLPPPGTWSVSSKLGAWEFDVTSRGLAGSRWSDSRDVRRMPPCGMRNLLASYFANGRAPLSAIPLDLPPGGEFSRKVQLALARIPPGRVITYGRLAASLGRPGASKAVGSACRANPAGLVLPCHRVVAAGGPGGYSGGDWVWLKLELLAHEGVVQDPDGRFPADVLLEALPRGRASR
ncbi:MGMT family protein [Candidatus Fermentibacteria bacterium]|nr:MGMT family protein [Candidatus Fermentibacteria bacterium]